MSFRLVIRAHHDEQFVSMEGIVLWGRGSHRTATLSLALKPPLTRGPTLFLEERVFQ